MKTNEEFINQLKEKGILDTLLPISIYTGCKNKISVKCMNCNAQFEITPNNLLSGQGCPYCGRNKIYDKTRKNFDVFKTELHEKNPTIEILGEYISNKEHILVKCQKCQTEWLGMPCHLIRGHGCPTCANEKRKEALRLARMNRQK